MTRRDYWSAVRALVQGTRAASKQCAICRQRLPILSYRRSLVSLDGYDCRCMTCVTQDKDGHAPDGDSA